MVDGTQDKELRPVTVRTSHGTIEGDLPISPRLRTLDELNLAAHKFLTIRASEVNLPGDSFEGGLVGINKDSILFVTEIAACGPRTDHRVERSHYRRSAVRLRVGEFDIQGFLHVRGLRDPLVWLSQNRQPFVALTSASVIGPSAEFATSFIAVNPRHVLAAQDVTPGEEPEVDCPEPASMEG